MTKDQLLIAIDLINDIDLHARVNVLTQWLRKGQYRDTVMDLCELLDYQCQLIEILQKEFIDLRIQADGTHSKFYPMSYTPRRR